jgi:hypothetical protein
MKEGESPVSKFPQLAAGKRAETCFVLAPLEDEDRSSSQLAVSFECELPFPVKTDMGKAQGGAGGCVLKKRLEPREIF